MRVKDQAQAEFRRGLLNFCDDCRHVLPLITGQWFMAVGGDAAREFLPFRSLRVGEHERLGAQSRKKRADFAYVLDHHSFFPRICKEHGDEGRKQRHSAAFQTFCKNFGIGREIAVRA